MSAIEPLRTLWEALEQHGCDPHGSPHDFRACCPGHEGENRNALTVREGADRRALVHCFAHGCAPERILTPLGLTVADLFPAGHRRARRRRLGPVQRSDLAGNAQVVAATIAALDVLGIAWTVTVATTCPYCRGPGAWLRVPSAGEPHADCPGGCRTGEFTGALAGRLEDREETDGGQ